MISENSRYYQLPLRRMTSEDGRDVTYLSRRFIPPRENLTLAKHHVVTPVDRLDIVSHTTYGDATQFWRIADYVLTRSPETLTDRPGTRLGIPLVAPPFVILSETEEDTL